MILLDPCIMASQPFPIYKVKRRETIREENYDKDTILRRRGKKASRLENGKKEFWENLIKGRGNDKLAIMEWWKMLKALSVKNIKDIQGEKPTVSIYSTGRFLDAPGSLDFKLSLSGSSMFFGF